MSLSGRPRVFAALVLVVLDATAAFATAADPEITGLIDRLTDVGEEGVGFHSTAWAQGFLAVDQEPRFAGGIIGSAKPVVPPALRGLVRKGTAALPDVLDHLSDRRETKVTVRGFMAMWHSDEYDPRQRPPQAYVAGPKPERRFDHGMDRAVSKYTLRVGDLCFVAVGQIVNRNLMATRYQPSMCLVINSPVETPALIASVRRDWGGLTPEQHRRSLTRDALAPLYDADPGALVRLMYYYPEEGEKTAIKLLERPVVNSSETWTFITTRLVVEKNPARWKLMVEQFRQDHGPAHAAIIPFLLRWIYWRTDFSETASFLDGRSTAAKILATVYADDDPNAQSFVNAADPRVQSELVEALEPFPSRRLDQAIHRMWRSCRGQRVLDENDRYEWKQLDDACVQRLFGRGYPDVVIPYLARKPDEMMLDVLPRLGEFVDELKSCLPLWLIDATEEVDE